MKPSQTFEFCARGFSLRKLGVRLPTFLELLKLVTVLVGPVFSAPTCAVPSDPVVCVPTFNVVAVPVPPVFSAPSFAVPSNPVVCLSTCKLPKLGKLVIPFAQLLPQLLNLVFLRCKLLSQ
jgi:hypothetical protein